MVEAINGVNSNNNTAYYSAGGAAVGAVAGGLGGYLSRPYIRNYLPTDSFCDAFISQARKANPEAAKQFDEGVKLLKNLESTDPLKFKVNLLLTKAFENIDAEQFAQLKSTLSESKDAIQKMGVEGFGIIGNVADAILKAENPAELKDLVSQLINKGLNNLSPEVIKDFIKQCEDNSKLIKKGIGISALLPNIDLKNGKILDLEGNAINELVKKAAKHVQIKTAGIYGVVGAALLGAGGYLASVFSNSMRAPSNQENIS